VIGAAKEEKKTEAKIFSRGRRDPLHYSLDLSLQVQ